MCSRGANPGSAIQSVWICVWVGVSQIHQCKRLKCSSSSPCASLLLSKKVRPFCLIRNEYFFPDDCVFTPLLHLSCKAIEHIIGHFSKVSLKLEDSVKVTQPKWHISWMHLKTWQIPCIKQDLIYTGEHCLDNQDGHYKSTQKGLCLDRRQNLYIHS